MILIRKNPKIEININNNKIDISLDENQIYAFDFDKTLYLSGIDFVKYANLIYRTNAEMIIESAKNSNKYSLNYLENLLNKKFDLSNNDEIINKIIDDFAKQNETNCGVSRMVNFGYTPKEIHKNFQKINKFAMDFYCNIKNNILIKAILTKAFELKKAIIWTDNSEEITIEGLKILNYPEEIYKNIPIVSMFKSINSKEIDKISTKMDEDIINDFCKISSSIFNKNITKNDITMFDDNINVVKNLINKGLKNTIFVNDFILECNENKVDFSKEINQNN